ncbi:hypothetical protein CRE_05796 [Caenorhabditis remanei]|uniref:T20D4.11-like domain-containing protein n=1 Tax=Caenorhabditis remanei TaxID=31234 RepID=E3M050_CAERE|nr:hypothetical protein CRE_05796 [Caenorhabditis remanei]
MTNLFTLTLVIGIFLLGIGYGANVPVTTEPSDIVTAGTSKNCTPLTGFRIISCFFRLGDYMRKLYFLDLKKKSSLKEFHKSCNSLHECISSMTCGKKDKEDMDMANKIGSYCSGLHYVFNNFEPCVSKFELEKSESKCFSTWSPFLAKTNNGTETTEENICSNFFGDDNCMKDEVTKVCSENEWKRLRNVSVQNIKDLKYNFFQHFIKITPEVKDCGFEDL